MDLVCKESSVRSFSIYKRARMMRRGKKRSVKNEKKEKRSFP